MTKHQAEIIKQMRADNGQILVNDDCCELERRSSNGVWGSQVVRRDTFEALKRNRSIRCIGLTGGSTTPDSLRFKRWKVKETQNDKG